MHRSMLKLAFLLVLVMLIPQYTTVAQQADQTGQNGSDRSWATLEPQDARSPLLQAPASVFGVELQQGNVAKAIVQAETLQPSVVRYNGILWSEVEPTPGQRNWSAMAGREAELQALGERNLSPIVIIRGTPPWAQAVPGSSCGPITSKPEVQAMQAFVQFVFETVQRYSAPPFNVKYWELWNEPDVDPSLATPDSVFGCWGDLKDPYYGGGYYADMLKAVYPLIKLADPQAVVVSGGLLLDCDPTTATQEKPCLSGKFLEGMLRNGGGNAVDVIAYHAYSYWNPQDKDWDANHPVWQHRGGIFLGKLDLIRTTMKQYNVNKPIMMNEGGLLCYQSSPNCLVPEFYEDQANQVVRLYTRTWAQGLWASVWFTLDGPGWQEGGLLDANQAPRPAYHTFKFLSGLLKDARFAYPIRMNNLEGYAFRKGDMQPQPTIKVLWTNDGSTVAIPLPSTTRAIYDKFGNAMIASGNTISIGFDPIIIELDELNTWIPIVIKN